MDRKTSTENASPKDAGRSNFPPPRSISPEAQAVLAAQPLAVSARFPDPNDYDRWRANIAKTNAMMADMWSGLSPGTDVCRGQVGGVPVVTAKPAKLDFPTSKVFFDIHGGALIYLGGENVSSWAAYMATRTSAVVVSVDYRMPPDHPYPAGLDDCVAAYRAAVTQQGAKNIVVGGSSAGGNLAAALMLRARDEGLPLPAGVVLLTPEVDLTESGDTFQTLLGIDRLGLLMPINTLYAAGTKLDDPYVSPLFGDFSKGFPPTFLQSGTRDLLLSNTVRMHRALREADIPAELHVWEAMPHGGFGGRTPEDEQVSVELRKFLARCWPKA